LLAYRLVFIWHVIERETVHLNSHDDVRGQRLDLSV
jgi:hypothetical protein